MHEVAPPLRAPDSQVPRLLAIGTNPLYLYQAPFWRCQNIAKSSIFRAVKLLNKCTGPTDAGVFGLYNDA